MKNSLSPVYLQDLVPKETGELTPYGFRHEISTKIRGIGFNTTFYKSTFLPNTIKDWNELNVNLRTIGNISLFRKSLRKSLYKNEAKKLFQTFNKPMSKHITQMRMGLSALRDQLFSYGIVNDPVCQYCFSEIEDPCHFLLRCSEFSNKQAELFVDLLEFAPADYWKSMSEENLTLDLLCGSQNFDYNTNLQILSCVARYIGRTERFTTTQ